jgi:glucose/arabinose dehydrogenase
MAFLGPNDILVLEKNQGVVKRIVNGKLLPEPLLRVPVANKAERGMLGIATSKYRDGHTYVFIYYTLSGGGVTGDDWNAVPPCCNVLYRYDFIDNKLINPKLLLSVPAGSLHNGGAIVLGPDNNLYIGIGDVGAHRDYNQNFGNSTEKTGSVIYRISQDGKPVGEALGSTDPTDKYYAYGIRNTFGIDFDPITKKLWDSENGPTFGDEINMIEPGFNSGWAKIQGLWEVTGPKASEVKGLVADPSNSSLVNYDGKGKYRSPELVWQQPVGLAGLKFLTSNKLGKEYENDLFVGDVNYGELYHFELNSSRTGLLLNDLRNKVIENPEDKYHYLFGTRFGHGITDLEVGSDGYLYVLTIPDWVKQERKTLVGGDIYVIKNKLT